MANPENPAALELVPQQEDSCASPGVSIAAPSVPPRFSGLVRACGRAPEVVMFEEAVVVFFLDAAEILGVPKSVAVIYGLCFASPEPLSFVDFNERLDLSQGSISQGLRVLREFGALRVTQLAHPEARVSGLERKFQRSARGRDFYAPDLKLRELAARWIEQRLERQLNSGNSRLQAIIEAIPPGRVSSRELMARLKYLEGWHQQSQALVPMIKALLERT